MTDTKKVLHAATAGFEEKNDLLVTVSPVEPGTGLKINLKSSVMLHYGEHIKEVIEKTVKERGFQDVTLDVIDKGAWDYTIKARVLAALERSVK